MEFLEIALRMVSSKKEKTAPTITTIPTRDTQLRKREERVLLDGIFSEFINVN